MSEESINISTSDRSSSFSFIRRNSPKGAGQFNVGTGSGFDAGDWAITHSSGSVGQPSDQKVSGHWSFFSERTIRSSKRPKNWDQFVDLECGGLEISGKGTAKIFLYKKDSDCGKSPGTAGKKRLIGKGKYKAGDSFGPSNLFENDNLTNGYLGINRVDTTSTRNGKTTDRVKYFMRLLDDTGDQGAMLIQMDLKKSFVAPTKKQSNKLGLVGELTSPLGVLAGDLDFSSIIPA
ncbi:hypothetical protein [Synechococcus sp. MIT S1220]|uniref:hypothetical protein n=1 Tax=Synechococcus sp. MIT S1220 TaxID=3082549 RepID=UPI0039B0D08C